MLPPRSPSPPSGSGRGPQRQQPSARAAGRGQGRVRGCARAANASTPGPSSPPQTLTVACILSCPIADRLIHTRQRGWPRRSPQFSSCHPGRVKAHMCWKRCSRVLPLHSLRHQVCVAPAGARSAELAAAAGLGPQGQAAQGSQMCDLVCSHRDFGITASLQAARPPWAAAARPAPQAAAAGCRRCRAVRACWGAAAAQHSTACTQRAHAWSCSRSKREPATLEAPVCTAARPNCTAS